MIQIIYDMDISIWISIKRTSRQERCQNISISLRLPWAAQWESAVALESDDPRCCIFFRSARDLSRLQIMLSS